MKVKTDEDAGENGGHASAGAEEPTVATKTNGAPTKDVGEVETQAVAGKKRAFEDEGVDQGEAKKAKAGDDS